MAQLNFCKACSVKRLKDVKTELEQWMAKRKRNTERCCICNVKLPQKQKGARRQTMPTTKDENYDPGVDETAHDEDVSDDDDIPEGSNKHYYDTSMITKGLDHRVLDLVESADDPDKPFQCKVCHAKCAKIYNFLRHLNHKHQLNYLQTKPYSCEFCLARFTCFTKLQMHFPTHAEAGTNFFKCSVCSATLKTIYALRKHMRRAHLAKRNVPCGYCGKLFVDKESATAHEVIHTNAKRHTCSFCKMTFRTQARLEQHWRKHSGAKPFVCGYCSQHFRIRGSRDFHERKFHTKVKGYQCRYCSFNCRARKYLFSHVTSKHDEAEMKKKNSEWKNYLKSISDEHTSSLEDPPVAELKGELMNYKDIMAANPDIHNPVQSDENKSESVSDLPPETISAISNLLRQADVDHDSFNEKSAADEVIYECQDCSFQCLDSEGMKHHMISSHREDGTSERTTRESTSARNETILYKCAACNFTSPDFADVDRHARSVHLSKRHTTPSECTDPSDASNDSGRGSYKCNKCSYACSDTKYLQIHKASHISVRTSPTNPVSLIEVARDVSVPHSVQTVYKTTKKSGISILPQALAGIAKHGSQASTAKSPKNQQKIIRYKRKITKKSATLSVHKPQAPSSNAATTQPFNQKQLPGSASHVTMVTATSPKYKQLKETFGPDTQSDDNEDISCTESVNDEEQTPAAQHSPKTSKSDSLLKTPQSKPQSSQTPHLTRSQSQKLSDHLISLGDPRKMTVGIDENKVDSEKKIVCQLYRQMPTKTDVEPESKGSKGSSKNHDLIETRSKGARSDYKRMTYM